MHNSQTTLGLIGCGGWGKNLARNFHSLDALHAICEADTARHTQLQDDYPGVSIYSNADELLQNPAISQVAIAAPAVQHYELAKQSLLAGKDVYVEKPLCLNAAHGQDLVNLAQDLEKILMVGHLLQYHPVVCKLQEMIDAGIFGKLFRITSRRLNLGKVRTEENALWSLAPHDISVILSLISGEQAQSVRSKTEHYLNAPIADSASVEIEFSNNVHAEIQVSWLHPHKEQKLCVIGEHAMAIFDDTLNWPNKLTLRKNYFENGKVETIPLDQQEPLKNECQHFLTACKSRRTPKTDGVEGLRVLHILEAAERSANEHSSPIQINCPRDLQP